MTKTNSITSLGLALCVEGDVAPEWIQLTPTGPDLDSRDGRKWKLSDPDVVVSQFQNFGQDLPVDFEHATQEKGAKGEPAPAVGWLTEMEARNSALWGKIDWLDTGREAVASRAYRYASPVFDFGRQTREISKIVSVGLTNQPNFQLTALNRAGEPEEHPMDKAALEALGLKDGASDGDVLTAINKLKSDEATARNRAEHPDSSSFVPKADYDLAMNRIRGFEGDEKTRQDAEITAAVDAAVEAGKIAPATRDYHTASCRAKGGLASFKTYIDASPVIAAKSDLDGKDPAKSGAALSAEEQASCRALGFTEAEFADAKSADVKSKE